MKKVIELVRDSDSGDWLLFDREAAALWHGWQGHAPKDFVWKEHGCENLTRPGLFEEFIDYATANGFHVELLPWSQLNPPTVGNEVV